MLNHLRKLLLFTIDCQESFRPARLGASLKQLEIVCALPEDEAGELDLILKEMYQKKQTNKKKQIYQDLTDSRRFDSNIPMLPSHGNKSKKKKKKEGAVAALRSFLDVLSQTPG